MEDLLDAITLPTPTRRALEFHWAGRDVPANRVSLRELMSLVVASTPEGRDYLSQQGVTKIMNLVDACQRLERGRGLFLFTDVATFKAQPRSIAGKPILQSFG